MQEIQVVIYSPDGEKTVAWTYLGKNLREVIAISSKDPGGSCGGRGTCGKCKVKIKGEASPLSMAESGYLLPEELKRGIRLACFCTIQGPLEVYLDYVPYNSKENFGAAKSPPFKPQAVIKHFYIDGLEKSRPIPLLKRISNACPENTIDISLENISQLARLDRAGRPALKLKALVFDGAIRYIGRNKPSAYGIALDIGTTSLFAYLADLTSGEVINALSSANMQRVYGSDMVSRISYCLEKENGLEELHLLVINNINSMIADLARESSIDPAHIYKIAAVGNPVMLHLFLGLSVKGFAAAPYSGLFIDKIQVRAASLGIDINPEGDLIILPQIGGFVGADAVACLLNIPAAVKNFLLIDIGTNGEIILVKGDGAWAASAAAGPAFEGGRISAGMRAGPGAVDQVGLMGDGQLVLNTIGGGPAKGICGSGIIDLISILLKGRHIDEFGIIDGTNVSNPDIEPVHANGGLQLRITDHRNGSAILITQQDIREVQLAKSAIRSAIDILLKQAGLQARELEAIYLAGAFGNVLKVDSCINIGLLPPVSPGQAVNIGNGAGDGALRVLLADEAWHEAAAWQSKVKYWELANDKDFPELFINNLNFQ